MVDCRRFEKIIEEIAITYESLFITCGYRWKQYDALNSCIVDNWIGYAMWISLSNREMSISPGNLQAFIVWDPYRMLLLLLCVKVPQILIMKFSVQDIVTVLWSSQIKAHTSLLTYVTQVKSKRKKHYWIKLNWVITLDICGMASNHCGTALPARKEWFTFKKTI